MVLFMLNVHFIHILKCELIKQSVAVSLGNEMTRGFYSIYTLLLEFLITIFYFYNG